MSGYIYILSRDNVTLLVKGLTGKITSAFYNSRYACIYAACITTTVIFITWKKKKNKNKSRDFARSWVERSAATITTTTAQLKLTPRYTIYTHANSCGWKCTVYYYVTDKDLSNSIHISTTYVPLIYYAMVSAGNIRMRFINSLAKQKMNYIEFRHACTISGGNMVMVTGF